MVLGLPISAGSEVTKTVKKRNKNGSLSVAPTIFRRFLGNVQRGCKAEVEVKHMKSAYLLVWAYCYGLQGPSKSRVSDTSAEVSLAQQ